MFGDLCSEDNKLRYSPPLPGTGPAGRVIPDTWLFLLLFQGHTELHEWILLNNSMHLVGTYTPHSFISFLLQLFNLVRDG